MPTWDQQIQDYEDQIKRLEGQVQSLLTSSSKAVLVFSGLAFVVGVIVGLAL